MKTNTKLVMLAPLLAMAMACAGENQNKRAEIGAGAGVATGAVVGGALGGWKGAAVGGVVGGVTGAAAGHILDRQAAELKQRALDTKRTTEGILVRLKEDLLFKVDSAELRPGASSELGKLSEVLTKYPEDRIEIRGYADSTGSEQHNEALSQRRADTVRRALAARGVKDDQMKSVGMGESDPVASNDTKEGRAQNRRVELHIALIQK